ncbi:MAG: TIGR03960 family B12-binding radical SAM protein, partial [Rectinemataceae bacterium]|nr:TIGR03960 family B12-binding radical SAM protein [Rectinemataceae bacterium]
LAVEKPARYLGGEYGSVRKDKEGLFTVALCFPDLYEIGMSNNAIRILYEGLNALPEVRCERVFAPAADFSALLAKKGLPLYTLESGIPLNSVDMIGFSVGYELCATNILSILDSGMVPLLGKDRTAEDPIVIAGGPAITNPHPFSMFLDAVFIGEAEAGFYDLVSQLASMKRSGAARKAILEKLCGHPSVWSPVKQHDLPAYPHKKAVRAIFSGFGEHVYSTALPLATTKTVQDHGTVEIMRGCPNGCRFCHAGYFYRPQRIKSPEVIFSEIERLVSKGGYREITLASLSSGDYPDIGELVSELNRRWTKRRVSFQLPSLKVDTFTLPLLESLSEIRKSGLTFAVETPVESWQASINKAVSFDRTVAILQEAKKRGFRQAKFYFMIGLPVEGFGEGEADAIIAFLEKICHLTTLSLSVNIGTFVPKPHTPFERSPQLSEESSLSALIKIKNGLRRFRNVKVSYHSPFISMLEGIITRGSDEVGNLILAAYKKGARLDAWEEHFDRDLWRSVLADTPVGFISDILSAKDPLEDLSWKDVSIRISPSYIRSESEKSKRNIFTSSCVDNCTDQCGSCGNDMRIVNNSAHVIPDLEKSRVGYPAGSISQPTDQEPGKRHWVVLLYQKTGIATYYQHLSIVEFFSRAFLMNDIPIAFSEGFNPMPRIETTPPLTMGADSECEVMQIPLDMDNVDLDSLVSILNSSLPEGIMITKARVRDPQPEGTRHRSLGSLYDSSEYRVECIQEDKGLVSGTIDCLCTLLEALGVVIPRREGSRTVTFILKDKNGGEHNLVRILEKTTAARPVLTEFRVTRLRSCLEENGIIKDLYNEI